MLWWSRTMYKVDWVWPQSQCCKGYVGKVVDAYDPSYLTTATKSRNRLLIAITEGPCGSASLLDHPVAPWCYCPYWNNDKEKRQSEDDVTLHISIMMMIL